MKTTLSRITVGSVALCALLASCAPSSDKVHASYVSPMQYHGYSCSQIRQEMMIVARKVSDVSGTQDHQAGNDNAAMGVGLVLFWPALFFLANKDQRTELATLKGQYEALEEAAVQKNCTVTKEIEAARKMEEKRKEKQGQDTHANKHPNNE